MADNADNDDGFYVAPEPVARKPLAEIIQEIDDNPELNNLEKARARQRAQTEEYLSKDPDPRFWKTTVRNRIPDFCDPRVDGPKVVEYVYGVLPSCSCIVSIPSSSND